MTEYVVGLLFDETDEWVVLVKKNRPEWQAGFLNGVGGKIEPGETSFAAMRREFAEETGVDSAEHFLFWRHTVTLTGPAFKVYFFLAHGPVWQAKTQTDEAIDAYQVDLLHLQDVVPNLRWIIPLSLNQHISGPMTGTVFPVEVFEENRGDTRPA